MNMRDGDAGERRRVQLRAVEMFKRAVALNADFLLAGVMLGQLYLNIDMVDEGIETLQVVLQQLYKEPVAVTLKDLREIQHYADLPKFTRDGTFNIYY